jgi:hypothetical protein
MAGQLCEVPHCANGVSSPTGAEHDAVVPPLLPAHVHVHGPVPSTADGAPALHNVNEG